MYAQGVLCGCCFFVQVYRTITALRNVHFKFDVANVVIILDN